jgi:serine/threonine protein kinase/Ran GTPase-activating protein (RanGAP) involved in mRNA processing and transport
MQVTAAAVPAVTLLIVAYAAASTAVCGKDDIGLADFQAGFVAALLIPPHCSEIDLKGTIVGDDAAASLAEAIKSNSAVTSFKIENVVLGRTGTASLAAAFSVNTAITTVMFTWMDIGDLGAVALADAFKVNTAITTVHLPYNNIGDIGAAALAEAIKVNIVLTSVHLDDNSIGNTGAAALAEALLTNRAIADLDLGSNPLGANGVAALAEVVKVNTVIRLLDLDNVNSGPDGIATIARALEVNSVITFVVLSRNRIGDAGAASLADMFKVNSAITQVDLSNNGIGLDGVAALCDALAVNDAITSIGLSFNNIGSAGAALFCDALKKNTAISSLYLLDGSVEESWKDALLWLVDNSENRSVSECGGTGIVVQSSCTCQCSPHLVLGSGPTCTDVLCGANHVGLASFQATESSELVIPNRCTAVDLHNSTTSDDGAAALARVLVGNTAISIVRLASNKIGNAGAIALASVVSANAAITVVDLSDNAIGELGAARLAEAIATRTAGITVDLRGNADLEELVLSLGHGVKFQAAEYRPICDVARSTKRSTLAAGLVAALVGAFAVIIVACAAFVLKLRFRQNKLSIASNFVVIARKRAEARFVLEYRQLVSVSSMVEFQRELEQLEVPRATLQVGSELGRGQSGVVFRGGYCDRSVNLAIKTRGDARLGVSGAAAVADEALMLEAMLLNGLRHHGIVTLLAVVTADAPVLICTELMENGDLRRFLRACRPTRQARRIDTIGTQHVVTPQVMVAMAAKLSSAMAFIERQSVIHRDVAARNVLVGKGVADVKLADLGAARSVHRSHEGAYNGVYVATSEHAPARWMSLEALREAKFSHKSDVFAFGVLLWEILTFGQTPWGAFGVAAFAQALDKGERLKCPQTFQSCGGGADARTAKAIFAIAMRCWNESPAKRPPFRQLETEFAVHHTVLATGAAARTGVVKPGESNSELAGGNDGTLTSSTQTALRSSALDSDGYVADAGFDQQPALDSDGYVTDAGFYQQAALDADGYVADAGFNQGPALDADGYVADAGFNQGPALDADGDVFNHAPHSPFVVTRGDAHVAGDHSRDNSAPTTRLLCRAASFNRTQAPAMDSVSHADYHLACPSRSARPDSRATIPIVSRIGIGARKDRNPSLYLGFGQDRSSSDGLDESNFGLHENNVGLSQATTTDT